jgi:cyanate permease
MSDQQTTASGDDTRGRTFFWIISVYVISTFLWRLLTPADELPSRTVQIMEMTLDFACVVGLLGMIKARGSNPLLWIAVVAGVGLFVIRMTSDDSWWTGHLRYSLSP